MASSRPGLVSISVIADAHQASGVFKKTEAELSKLGKTATHTQGPLGGVSQKLGVLAGGLAAGAVIKSFKAAISATVDWGSQVKSLTRLLGVTAAEASGLAVAAHHFGLEADDLSKGLGIFEKKLVAGDKAIASAGIHFRDARGAIRPFNDVLRDTADVFAKMPDGPTKTALALNLFGRGGKALIPILNQGAAGLKKFDEEAKKLGLSLSGTQLKAISDYKFAQRDLGLAIKGLEVQLGLKAIPTLTTFFQVLSRGAAAFNKIPAGVLTASAVFGTFIAAVLLAKRVTEASQAALEFLKLRYEALRLAVLGTTAAQEVQTAVTAEQIPVNAAATGSLLGLYGGQVKATAGSEALASALALQQTASGGAAVAATGLARALPQAAVFLAAGKAVEFLTSKIDELFRGRPDINRTITALEQLSSGAINLNEALHAARIDKRTFDSSAIQGLKKDIQGLGGVLGTIDRLGADAFGWIPGIETNAEAFSARVDDMDKALASLVSSGNAKAAKQIFDQLQAALGKDRLSSKRVEHFFDDYTKALSQAGAAAQEGADGLEHYRFTLQQTASATEDFNALLVKGAPREFVESLKSQGEEGVVVAEQLLSGSKKQLDEFVALWQSSLGKTETAINVFAGMTVDEFKTWKAGTVESFNGVQSALDEFSGKAKLAPREILRAFDAQLKAQRDYQKNWQKLLARGLPQDFAKQLQDMGLKGAGFVKALANANSSQFTKIIADWIKAQGVAAHTADSIDVMGAATKRLDSTQLKELNLQFDKIKLRGDIRTVITNIVKEQGPIPLKELQALLRGLGLKGTILTRVIASVRASVSATVTSFRVSPAVLQGLVNQGLKNRTFQEGGYNVGIAGGRPNLALLHPKEYVLNPKATASIGLARLERLNRFGARALSLGTAARTQSNLVALLPRSAVSRDGGSVTVLRTRPVQSADATGGVDEARLARCIVDELRRAPMRPGDVYLDGQPVGRLVAKHLGNRSEGIRRVGGRG